MGRQAVFRATLIAAVLGAAVYLFGPQPDPLPESSRRCETGADCIVVPDVRGFPCRSLHRGSKAGYERWVRFYRLRLMIEGGPSAFCVPDTHRADCVQGLCVARPL